MKERADIPSHLKWKTEDIFKSGEEWEKLYRETEKELDLSVYRGKLNTAENLLACFQKLNTVTAKISKLGVYAFMRHDEDTRNSEFTALLSRAELLQMKFAEQAAFITPELTDLPLEKLEEFARDERLRDYDYTLRMLIQQKPHVLSAEVEQLLSLEGRVFSGYQNVFSMIDNADFPFPTIRSEKEKICVTHSMFGVCMRSPNRRLRRSAFTAYYKAYIGLINTITAAYTGNVEKDVFLAKIRKYDSCLSMALHGEDVSTKVYDNLLKSVNEALPILHRYFADRKKILGLPKLHMWDIHTSLVEDADIQVDYEEAFRIVKTGLHPLGEEYERLLNRAHDEGWIDVEETAGKRSGAYSISVFGLAHPYVLLNYQQTTGDIFTIAHELGHAMHSYFSERSQPQEKADYRIFVAEVASTVNEVLLIKHLLNTSDDPKLRKYLLSYYMDTIKSTLFRQTQFAEFEYIAHEMAQNGEPLTKDVLCEKYLDLNRKYYGDSVVSDPEIAYEWARIPHFYTSFYVYKYATGIISAVSIAERILSEGAPAVADYFRFLSSGGSDSPVELLKLAGVDLEKPDAYKRCMQSFKDALDEFEQIP